MIQSRTRINNKTRVTTPQKREDTQKSQRGKRGNRNVPLQQHVQIMREAKRLREQIRVRAVNAEYAHLNQTLGLKKQCKSLPKISKQQTLKTCIGHIKLLRAELSDVIGQTPSEDHQFHDSPSVPILPRPPLYMPSFPLYIPSYYPPGHEAPETAELIDTQHDDVINYPPTHFPYIQSYPEDDYDTGLRTFQEEDSSISDFQNNSENFDSDLSTDFPTYTDSFCSTPDSGSSNFSWFISSDWANLDDN